MKCCTSELHQTFRFKGANFVGFLRAVVTNVRFFPHSLRLFGDWGMNEASGMFGYPESVVYSFSPGPKTILFYYHGFVVP
jgi:hypothetical protein